MPDPDFDLAHLRHVFGDSDLLNGLAHRLAHSARFALGGGGAASADPALFLEAHRRAMAVCAAAFPSLRDVCALIYLISDSAAPLEPYPETIESLATLGLDSSGLRALGSEAENDREMIERFGADNHRHAFLYRGALASDDVERLLWGALASETPVRPRLEAAHLVLVSCQSRTALRVYDDRFVDLVAPDAATLQRLKAAFQAWDVVL